MRPLSAHLGFGGISAPASSNSQANAQQIHSYTLAQRSIIIAVLAAVIILISIVSIMLLSRHTDQS